MDEQEMSESCADCAEKPGYGEGVHLLLSKTAERFLCARCARLTLARRRWKDTFEYPDFAPLSIKDADGRPRRFEFTTHHIDTGIEIQMFEAGKRGEGYELEILGDFDADLVVLFRSLLARMRRALGRRHLEVKDGCLQIRPEGLVRGLLDRDQDRGDAMPLVVVDGRPVSWDAFGRMLLQRFEGFQFKLEIYDLSEEIGDEILDRSRFLMSKTDRRKLN